SLPRSLEGQSSPRDLEVERVRWDHVGDRPPVGRDRGRESAERGQRIARDFVEAVSEALDHVHVVGAAFFVERNAKAYVALDPERFGFGWIGDQLPARARIDLGQLPDAERSP